MSQMPGDMGSIILARNNSPEDFKRFQELNLPEPNLPRPGGEMPQMRTMDFQDANRNGIDDRDEATGGPAPMPGGPVMGYPEMRFPQPQPLPGGVDPGRGIPQPMPIPGGGLFDKLRPAPKPMPFDDLLPSPIRLPEPMPRPMPRPMPGQPDQRMPPRPPGAGSLFDTPDKNDYNRLLANAYQDQYRNAPSPYAAQADYLMNRPVFDRGPRTDDPMFAFRAKDDPFAAMRRQQPVRDEANAAAAAAAKAQQDKLAADEAAAAQAALDATTAEEAAAAKAEQERIAAEKAIAAQAETDRVAAEAAAAQAAETAAAAAAQEEAAAAAAATQAAAEAESLRIAQEAEAQRQAALQARLDAMEGQFGDFTGRFGNFDPATIQANIAAAQAASAANAATIADTPAVDPDLAARIAEMQGQFGDFSGILDGFDPAALQANIAAAQASADANAATIADTPAVDPDLAARIAAMQGELGGFSGRFEGFDPAALRAQIEGLSLGDGAGIGSEGGATAPGFVAPVDRTVQKSREGIVNRDLGGMDKDAIRARIDALQGGTPLPKIDPDSLFSDPGLGGNKIDLQSRIEALQGGAPSLPGGGSYSDVVAAGNGGINPKVGTRADGTTIRLFDPDNPNRQGNPAPLPKPQIDPDSLFSDPGLGGGRAPTPAPRVDNPRVMPGPVPGPAPGPAPVVPRPGTPASQYDPSDPYYNNTGVAGGRTLPPKPQIDPSSLFSDPGLGGGRAPTPAPRVDNPRVMPGPVPGPAPVVPRPGTVPKPKIDPDSLFSDPGLGGGPVPRPRPAPRVDNPRVMPAPVPVPGPAPVVPSAPSGDFQSNVDFMNQMATKNAQVGSDGQAVMPSFTYDAATNEYVRDSSAFGLTGDAAITRYSPEEFQQEFGRTLSKQGSAAPKPKTMPKSAPKVIAGPKPVVISDPVNPKPKPVPRGKITDRRKVKRGRKG